ncbi:MAG: hypothetical protein AB7F31_04985 [Parachlamydiales bacterium]
MTEGTHLIPQLNQDVEQHIWSFLDLPDLDRVAVSSKGGQASIGHFRQTQPEWWVVRELRREGADVDTEAYHKAGLEAVKACSELWGKERGYPSEDQEIRQLSAEISTLNSRSTRLQIGSVGLFLSLSIYGLVRKCWRLPYPKLALWGGLLTVGPIGLWQLGSHFDRKAELLNSQLHILRQQKESRLDAVTNEGFKRVGSAFFCKEVPFAPSSSLLGKYEFFLSFVSDNPLSKLQYAYKIDEVARRGIVSRNQFIAAKILIQIRENRLVSWLKEAEQQSREELIGKMSHIEGGRYWADSELPLIVREREPESFPARSQPLESVLCTIFNRFVIQDAGLEKKAYHYPKSKRQFYKHPFYGGL